MMLSPWIAALVAIFTWWFFTGVILFIVRKSDGSKEVAHSRSVFLSIPFAALGVAGLFISAAELTTTKRISRFHLSTAGLGLDRIGIFGRDHNWSRTYRLPYDIKGWDRFYRAYSTLMHHELLLVSSLLVVVVICANATNTVGMWTYLILYAARISAKLNLFFGVPHINTEFVPKPLEHLKSYFTQGRITIAFPIGVTFLSLAFACFTERWIASETSAQAVGFALLTSMAALAAIEHWLMVVPLPDAKLWRWMLPKPTTVKTGDSHEL
jgi:putative photosynthetic complex assembly protein 2